MHALPSWRPVKAYIGLCIGPKDPAGAAPLLRLLFSGGAPSLGLHDFTSIQRPVNL
jgi:hypothetical protein